jgi:hypothetical protein
LDNVRRVGSVGGFRIKCAAMFLWTDLIDLVRHPFSAMRLIDVRRRLPEGLLALALSVSLPAAVAELAALGPFRPPANLGSLPSLSGQGLDIYARWTYQHRFVLPLYGLAISLVAWLAAVGLIHLVVRALKGRGDFQGYLKLAGYAALVGVVALPFAALEAAFRIAGNARAELAAGQLAGLVSVMVFLWQNGLLVLAARDHYGVSTGRAVSAVVGPIGCVIALGVALIILAVILALLARQPAPL